MKKNPDCSETLNLEECAPRISIIIPYDRKSNKPETIFNNLSLEADKIEKELMKRYPEEKASPVIDKLRHLIQGISPGKEGESMGIFVSPCTEKIYYFTPTDLPQTYFPPVLVK
jgi:hypothetical protein